jgi:putative endonuclease
MSNRSSSEESARDQGRKAKGRAAIGRQGEEEAARHLQVAGYCILERNFRTRRGEIDIVAEQRDGRGLILVFVEVKVLDSLPPEAVAYSVNARKRRTIRGVAEAYLYAHPERKQDRVRFDVIVLQNGFRDLQHLEAAFTD